LKLLLAIVTETIITPEKKNRRAVSFMPLKLLLAIAPKTIITKNKKKFRAPLGQFQALKTATCDPNGNLYITLKKFRRAPRGQFYNPFEITTRERN
jgi:hypothetical protein